MTQSLSHLIDADLVAGRREFDVVNPATGAPFARCPDATNGEVDAAMGAAARAFAGDWSRDEAARRRTLVAMSEALGAAADEIGRLVCLEQLVQWVNQHIETGAFAPFGGMKWSGIGRENGRWGIEEFCDLQVVSTRLA